MNQELKKRLYSLLSLIRHRDDNPQAELSNEAMRTIVEGIVSMQADIEAIKKQNETKKNNPPII